MQRRRIGHFLDRAEGAALVFRQSLGQSTVFGREENPIAVVDTIGAGDTFNGALAASLARQEPWPKALQLANAAAALRVMPISTPSSNSYIIANNDLGNIITVAAGNVYITTNSSFAPGSVMRVWNNSSSFTTITQNTGTTIYLANSTNSSVQALTGNRYLSPRGLATITCVAANTFVVNGTGLT